MTSQNRYWDALASNGIDASTIDPNDLLGRKNSYLSGIRNNEIIRRLHGVICPGSIVLDLGCGTGGLSKALCGEDWLVAGLDISSGLLHRSCERGLFTTATFMQYDGSHFPISDASVDAITTYVVLNHILEAKDLSKVLDECSRVLKPSGKMICVEQISRRPKMSHKYWKLQRTTDGFTRAFTDASFSVRSVDIVRYGHFPVTPLIRYGLVPRSWFGFVAACERWVGRYWKAGLVDYADAVFVLEKSRL